MIRNKAGQHLTVFVFNRTTGAPVTGIAATITAAVSKDFETWAALSDLHPDEDSAALAPGKYTFDLLKSETDADNLRFTGQTTTPNTGVICQWEQIEFKPQHGSSSGSGCCGLAALQAQSQIELLQKLVDNLCPTRS